MEGASRFVAYRYINQACLADSGESRVGSDPPPPRLGIRRGGLGAQEMLRGVNLLGRLSARKDMEVRKARNGL